ncbi:MAG TPA: amidohydrolase family protein [Gemmatimonadaceae bacterium]|nr:amidohydrolase family protein [Gemmatimonadaceae bacterium]
MSIDIRSAAVAARRALGATLLTVGAITPAAAQSVAITGGRVHTATGAPIDGGTVLIRDGRIVAVGRDVTIPQGVERIDATGKWVTPGLINANTQLGLIEVGQVSETRNASARGRGDAINAAFTVWDGLNPASALLAQARDDGVTTVGIIPTGGLIAGQAAVIDLVDGSVSDMLVRQPVAMVGQVGRAAAANTNARGELIVKLRELLEDTRTYSRRRADFERAETRPFAASRLDLEAMIPVVQGRLPFIVAADKASDIEAVLELSKQYGLRPIISGGAEGWMIAEKLAAAKVPVMAGAMNNLPGDFSTLGTRQENAALLRRAGVTVLLIGNGPGDPESFNVRNVRQEAGNAVAYGMSWDDAFRAVTIVPAEVLGVADRVGSLAAGREGNVVVWSGDPFELSTTPERVFVRGREITAPTREELLTERYKRLPPTYNSP